MSKYVQTSTDNPVGRRPWQTRLYTGFEDYGFLKQPQNKILREDLSMRPEIYRPPELKLGDATVVTGSGRIVQRGRRRRRGGLGIIPAMFDRSQYSTYGGRTPAAQWGAAVYIPPPTSTMVRAIETPSPVVAPPPKPLTILPPPSPPAVPQPVARTQTGTIYVLPGSAPTSSAYAPPPTTPSLAPLQTLPSIPGVVMPSGDGAPAAAESPAPSVSTFSEWFNSATWVDGIPNGYVAIGVAGVIYLFARKRR